MEGHNFSYYLSENVYTSYNNNNFVITISTVEIGNCVLFLSSVCEGIPTSDENNLCKPSAPLDKCFKNKSIDGQRKQLGALYLKNNCIKAVQARNMIWKKSDFMWERTEHFINSST